MMLNKYVCSVEALFLKRISATWGLQRKKLTHHLRKPDSVGQGTCEEGVGIRVGYSKLPYIRLDPESPHWQMKISTLWEGEVNSVKEREPLLYGFYG